ncbi:LacI family DNA-binding transcriptional regulator [Streptomyces chartreusis]|uniref:LacI family DNA-binding transcriptional regulator n=1 Tax=Streptomyces chartreusis TaxID=1969 RepID=UPI0036470F72
MWERSQRQATVGDVARLAGVSKATAARVLGQYGSSSDAARAAVHAAAAALSYRPNASAKTMNTGRSESIGVISRNVVNPGFAVALDGIMAVGAAAGVSVVVAGSEYDLDLERAAIESLLNKRVDALIVSPARWDVADHIDAAHRAGVPIVLLERRATGLEVPVVQSDMAGAGRVIGRHLRSLGHTRVGMVSTFPHAAPYELGEETGSSVMTDRLQAVYGTYAEAGIRPSTELVRFAARTSTAIQREVSALLDHDDPPTALIASDGQIGIEVLTVLRARGVSIPRDISVIMFEDAPWATLVDPPLTVVVQPTYEMGRTAAEVALAAVGTEGRVQRVPLFPAELVLRDSVGPAPR